MGLANCTASTLTVRVRPNYTLDHTQTHGSHAICPMQTTTHFVGQSWKKSGSVSRWIGRILLCLPLVSFEKPVAAASADKLLSAPRPPKVRFTDVTAESGIRFVHVNGAEGEKLLPETMGGGCAFLDFDADGHQDIFFVNSTVWPGSTNRSGATATGKLYRNTGTGRFVDVTEGSGLDVALYGMGVAVGDYDNDGLPDLFVTALGGNRLFHNRGKGRFQDVTSNAGIRDAAGQWSTSCAWIDFNNDGLLDLFVCNYLHWTPEIDRAVNPADRGVKMYGRPFNFQATYPLLYRNDGQGKFTEVSERAGLRINDPRTGKPAAKSLGVAPVDLDGDGWMDLIVANDTVPNLVFHNEKDGTFKEVGALSGLAYDGFGNVRGAMGIDTAWFRDDASLGVAIANFANEMNGFYVAAPGSFQFSDEASLEPMGPASRPLLKFGLFFFDYDLDGWPDLLTSNGHLDADIGRAAKSQSYAQPAQLFWNGGPQQSTTFTLVTAEQSGTDLFKPMVGRGATFADIDGDGDLDVLLTQIGGAPRLLRNDQRTGHGWLRVTLVGTRSNHDAIGAVVTLKTTQRLWRAQVMPTRSYLSQSELPLTFGFGKDPAPQEMEIRWPSGTRQRVPIPVGEHRITVREP